MSRLSQFIVNAFVEAPFSGNPAAVVPLQSWLDDAIMQTIAAQNNLSETAFFTSGEDARIRWFTPTTEVDLCGHATLASAHVLFAELDDPRDSITFASLSGALTVTRGEGGPVLDFPAIASEPIDPADADFASVAACADVPVETVLRAGIWRVLVTESADDVEGVVVDLERAAALPGGELIVTAAGDRPYDVCSRVFGPGLGIDEDPVTGSAHCVLAPYWTERLGKSVLSCRQASERGGRLEVTLEGDRVKLAGACATFSRGTIEF